MRRPEVGPLTPAWPEAAPQQRLREEPALWADAAPAEPPRPQAGAAAEATPAPPHAAPCALEVALRHGAAAGLAALAREAQRLPGVAAVALWAGPRRLAAAGPQPPARGAAGPALRVGGARLAVRETAPGALDAAALEALRPRAAALLAAHAREQAERAVRAELRRDNARLRGTLARQDGRRSRAAHDLRSPLSVAKGYHDMLKRALGNAVQAGSPGLAPAPQRYFDRMGSALEELGALMDARLRPEPRPPVDLAPLLRRALEAPRGSAGHGAHLEVPPGRVEVRAGAAEAWALVRSLAALLGAAGGPPGEGAPADASVDSPPGTATWRVRLVVQTQEAPDPARVRRLAALVQRLGGHLAVQARPRLSVTVHLPRAE